MAVRPKTFTATGLADDPAPSVAEIATRSTSNVPAGTVMSRISRGRRMLFERLQHLKPVNA